VWCQDVGTRPGRRDRSGFGAGFGSFLPRDDHNPTSTTAPAGGRRPGERRFGVVPRLERAKTGPKSRPDSLKRPRPNVLPQHIWLPP
jgi:hypothetical protein